MNLCKSLKIDLTRAFQNKWFPAGILLTAAVLAANLPWENMPDPSVLYLVSLIAWGSYTQMICICGVIPFGTAYLAEREHQYIRYLVFRSDIRSYLRSKVIVTVFSGFATVFLGKLLLAGTARLFCPMVSRWEWYDPAEKGIDCLKALCPWGYVLADAFLYALAGAAFALMALLVSAVTIFFNTDARVTEVDSLFEAVSAYATVGLSTGATVLMNTPAKLITVVTMFIGRVGPVSLLISLARLASEGSRREVLPEARISVG